MSAIRKPKLELTWIGKEHRPKPEPRILLEDPEKSYHALNRISAHDIFDNRLIFGDNLLALKALEQEFAGKIKCIYIDPPFNTGQAFSHYDDGIEHSLWLSMMRDRVKLLFRLLCDSGVIFIHLDDNEQAYFKVVMDEIFGRENFLFTFVWRNVDSPHDNKAPVAANHNFILCFAKAAENVEFNPMEDHSILDAYPNKDEQDRLYRDRLLKKKEKTVCVRIVRPCFSE